MHVITLDDGVKIQIELSPQQATEISGSARVDATLNSLKESFKCLAGPISNYAAELEINEKISQTKISLGLKVGIEGNFILSKSSADAHITLEFTIKS